MIVSVIRILCVTLLISPITCEQYVEIEYFPATSTTDTCLEVCEYNGYQCYDNVLQSTDCLLGAMETCGRSSMKDESHAYQCNPGGCYVDCNSGVYADRGEAYLTCYSTPICHGSNTYDYQFTKICTCAVVTTVPPKPLHIYLWEIIGIATLFLAVVAGMILLVYFFFPGIFPSWYVIY